MFKEHETFKLIGCINDIHFTCFCWPTRIVKKMKLVSNPKFVKMDISQTLSDQYAQE